MTNVVGTITGYRKKSVYTGNWGSWVTNNPTADNYISSDYMSTSGQQHYMSAICYRFEVNNNISGWSAEKIYFKAQGKVSTNSGTRNHELKATFYDVDPTVSSGSGTDGGTLSIPYNQKNTFKAYTYETDVSTFTGEKVFYAVIELTNVSGINSDNFTPLEVGVTVAPPLLGLTITPDPVVAGDTITVTYTNQLDQTINVVFKANGKELDSYSSQASSVSMACPYSWFSKAGLSGGSMEITAIATDDYERSATVTFTLELGELEVNVSPLTVGPGDSVSVSLGRVFDASIRLEISCNGVALDSFNVYNTYTSFTVYKSWLSTIRDSYATLDIVAIDSTYNRRGEASVSLSVRGIELTLSKSSVKAGGDGLTGGIDYRYDEPVRLRVKSGSAIIEERASLSSDSFTLSPTLEWFSSVGETGDSMNVTVEIYGLYTERTDYGSFDVLRPVLSVSATSPVTAGNSVTLAFGERNGSTLTVKLRSGNTVLASPASFSADGLTVATQQKWFQDLSVTTLNYIEVTVEVTGSDGRAASTTFRLEAGDDMAPTISGITFSAEQPTAAMRSAFPGIYVAGYTKLKVSATVSAKYSASAWQVNFTIAGSAPTEMSQSSGSKWEGVSINPVTVNGDVVVSVVDSRGLRSESKLRFSSITAYNAPSVSAISFHRCREDRTKDDSGGYCLISATFTISPVANKNSKSAAIASSIYNNSQALSSYTQTLEWFFAADIEHSYEITLSAIDTITRMDATVKLSTAGVIMDFLAGGKGIGLGKVAEYSETVEVNPEWTLKAGSIELNGSDLGQLLQQIDQRLRNGGL